MGMYKHVCILLQKELEGALSSVCRQFNVRSYEQVQSAYGILGKTQVSTCTWVHAGTVQDMECI